MRTQIRRWHTLSRFLALVCVLAGVSASLAKDYETLPESRVAVLGYGGTIAGKAQGAYKQQYAAGGFCLQDIVCNLLRDIEGGPQEEVCSSAGGSCLLDGMLVGETPSQCGDRPCMACTLGTTLCDQGGGCQNSVSCEIQLPAGHPPWGPECSCGADGCYCQTEADFCDIERLDSSQMTPVDWATIAEHVQRLVRDPDVAGVVITHGTDTLEETAYFLHLVLDTDKPVVLVGAMRAANHLSADGYMNLMNAIALASSEKARGKGVFVMLNDTVHGGRDVTKRNTTNPATFHSPNTGPLAVDYFGDIDFYSKALRKHTERSEFHFDRIDSLMFYEENGERRLREDVEVDMILDYAGNPGVTAEAILEAAFPGVVIAGTGNGSVGPKIKEALCMEEVGSSCRGREKPFVVRGSRVGSGRVTRVSDDFEFEILTADDLSPQKARILLMLGLAVTKDLDHKERFLRLRAFFEQY